MNHHVSLGTVPRIPILELTPRPPGLSWPAKAYLGEVIPFSATVFREGHDMVGAELIATTGSGTDIRERMRLTAPGTDRMRTEIQMRQTGDLRWRVRAFSDDFETWRHDAELKIAAGVDVELMYEIGARLLERAAGEKNRLATTRTRLTKTAALLRNRTATKKRFAVLSDPELRAEFDQRPLVGLISESDEQILRVERERAGVGAWYEFFPRSEGAHKRPDGSWKSGSFRTAETRLDQVSAMGFNVVYLPPIHPIGRQGRKGPNNTLHAGEHDPGSPWAIGGAEGGHDALHPDLGTLQDFQSFIAKARSTGLEIAMDLALQASPDHPWVREHPEWFTTLPDGTIRYAENPPKKYQDIYPLNFDNDPQGIRDEVLRIVRYWIDQGIRIFRVDNPHTKPLDFWEWLIGTVWHDHPEVIFLAEAFTRPALLQALAKVGFQQSYTYFTWRNTKAELTEFLTGLAQDTADFLRPNLFVNTPDILTEYLQFGGPAAFTVRATIAATAAPTWGVYSGFELFESIARPGAEEAINNEKYEYKPRDFARAEKMGKSLALYLGILNRIRQEHPALGQLRNLRFHHSDDDAVLVYSKHLDGRFTPTGKPNTIIVVVNTDPHSVRETSIHLDLPALGLADASRFGVTELVTGETWEWGASNYVRLDAFTRPAHILEINHELEMSPHLAVNESLGVKKR